MGLEGASCTNSGMGGVGELQRVGRCLATDGWRISDWRLVPEFKASGLWGFDSLAFDRREDAVDCGDSDFLDGTAGPANLELFDFGCRAESEMDTRVGGGGVTAAAENVGALPNPARGEEYFCADNVALTLRAADQFQREPVIFALDDVAKKRGRRVDVVEDNVDVAIVE